MSQRAPLDGILRQADPARLQLDPELDSAIAEARRALPAVEAAMAVRLRARGRAHAEILRRSRELAHARVYRGGT